MGGHTARAALATTAALALIAAPAEARHHHKPAPKISLTRAQDRAIRAAEQRVGYGNGPPQSTATCRRLTRMSADCTVTSITTITARDPRTGRVTSTTTRTCTTDVRVYLGAPYMRVGYPACEPAVTQTY